MHATRTLVSFHARYGVITTIIIAVLLSLLVGLGASNGETGTKKQYELLTGIPEGVGTNVLPLLPENLELCQAYERNLNAFANLPYPLACERPIHPDMKDFSTPVWQTLDPHNHVELIKKMDRLLFYRWHPENFHEQQWTERLKQRLAENRITLRLTRVDVMRSDKQYGLPPDGIPENLLQYDYRGDPCDPTDERWLKYPQGISYFVVNDELTEIHELPGIPQPLGVFLYKGQVYFDALSRSEWDDAFTRKLPKIQYEVYLLKPVGPGTAPICRYRYLGPLSLQRKQP
jgi:hypothetical protein